MASVETNTRKIVARSGLLEAIDDAARNRGLTRSGFHASAAREKIAQGR